MTLGKRLGLSGLMSQHDTVEGQEMAASLVQLKGNLRRPGVTAGLYLNGGWVRF